MIRYFGGDAEGDAEASGETVDEVASEEAAHEDEKEPMSHFGSARRTELDRGRGSLNQTFKHVSAGAIDTLKWRASYRVRIKKKRNFLFHAVGSGAKKLRGIVSGTGTDPDSMRNEDKYKQILDDVVGEAHKGQLLAIMGPSGSGKTSLLNVLAGRIPRGGELTGDILVDGIKKRDWRAGRKSANTGGEDDIVLTSQHRFSHVSAYVQQDDILFPQLTVEETFNFAAHMRLPRTMSATMKAKIRDSIVTELGLRKTLKTMVGGAQDTGPLKGGRGISGGERKRVNIGVEMIRLPSVLFLDEPTSGLDSFQAQNVVETMNSLARNGRIVISTIHQPRSSIYELFDQLLLLDDSGREAYFGPASMAIDYFEEAGCTCPVHFNPADFFLDVIATDYRTKEDEEKSKVRIEAMVQQFRRTNSLYIDAKKERVEGLPDDEPDAGDDGADAAPYSHPASDVDHAANGESEAEYGGDDDDDDDDGSEAGSGGGGREGRMYLYGASWLTQLRYLYGRQLKIVMRNRSPMLINIAQGIFFAVLVGLLYHDMGKDYQGILDRTGLLFFSLINVSLGGVFMALTTFPKEKPMVNCERDAKVYHVSAYYLAKYLSDLPFRIGVGLIFGAIVYWIAGLNPGFHNYVMYMVLLVLIRLGGESIGLFVSALMPSFELAQAVAPVFLILFLLFGGFYINQESMPAGAKWVKYTSMYYWGFTALSRNEFMGETFTCSLYPNCTITGEEQLEILGFNKYTIADSVAALILIQLCFHCFALLALRFMKPRYLAD